MSKEIARTIGGKKIAWLIAIITAVVVTITLVTQATAASPPSNVTFTKDCVGTGSEVVYCTILVENKSALIVTEGEGDESDTVEIHYTPRAAYVQDFLPDDSNWFVLSAYVYDSVDATPSPLECELDTDILVCEIPPIPGQHLNKLETAFVNGYAQIVIYGLLERCGEVKNTALLVGVSLLPKQASGTAAFPCPVTATPTSQPTSTPTSQASPTAPPPATIIVVTATPTARIIPLPPKTGDTPPSNKEDDTPYYLYGILAAAAIAFGVGGFALSRRR